MVLCASQMLPFLFRYVHFHPFDIARWSRSLSYHMLFGIQQCCARSVSSQINCPLRAPSLPISISVVAHSWLPTLALRRRAHLADVGPSVEAHWLPASSGKQTGGPWISPMEGLATGGSPHWPPQRRAHLAIMGPPVAVAPLFVPLVVLLMQPTLAPRRRL